MKIFVLGTGKGEGVVVEKSTKKKTFMKMVQVGGGLGIGAKTLKLIFVFDNDDALDKFVNAGGEFGGAGGEVGR